MGRGVLAVSRPQRAGNERFLEAFAAARADLLQALTGLLGNPDDAQDAVQEAFLKCWRVRERVPGVRNLRAWIFRVGLNAAKDLQRNVWRRRARPLLDQAALAGRPGSSPGEQLLRAEALERLRAALADLRPAEREVFLLRQNSDLTYDEIAARRHTPVGTIKTQMRTALHKLRHVLQDQGTGSRG
jgi:RNA polymerase sigma-70 factor (ECF subfamily)